VQTLRRLRSFFSPNLASQALNQTDKHFNRMKPSMALKKGLKSRALRIENPTA